MFVVAAFYQFKSVADTFTLKQKIESLCTENSIRGLILVASEGINGTISSSRAGVDNLFNALRLELKFDNLEYKESTSDSMPFYRMNIKLKNELIALKKPYVNPSIVKGIYVEPKDWNDLISKEDVVLIDTRNDYEVLIGKFKNAINPNTKSFSQFPEFVEKNMDILKGKKIAMYCTGGIRCEKASSYMMQENFSEVYHLKGGILKYLEEIAEPESLWEGKCYVFDQRVSVGHGLIVGDEKLCFACRHPLSADDQKDENHQEGIQCKYCVSTLNDEIKMANKERQKQMELSKERNTKHLGISGIDVQTSKKVKARGI